MKRVAILVYGRLNDGRNALREEKYKDLASALEEKEFDVSSVLYNDEVAEQLAVDLLGFDAVLVWVNPIEQGTNRSKLDALLIQISDKGCFVSAHPETILKMCTKDVLFKTRQMDWGSDTKLYSSFDEFTKRFPGSLYSSGIRVLKQYRGNGGNGVFKITSNDQKIQVLPADKGAGQMTFPVDEFFKEFNRYFRNQGLMIDQSWNRNIKNGMVRCYLSGSRVAGFGYQEVNAFYELGGELVPPGKRYYFTENCGIFQDLRQLMESKWVSEMAGLLSVQADKLPVIWDADFFINHFEGGDHRDKYTLCEINTSSVSPFPPSSVRFMIETVSEKLKERK